ncbi:hypothetical protein ACU686_07420 [Yinghuangia aomiensis]
MSHLALTRTPARPATGRSRRGAFLFVLAFLLFPAVLAALGAAPADAATSPPPSPGASAAPSEATVSLDPATTKPDGIVKVTGGGWTPGSMVNVAICGQNAMSGTRSCAVPTSITLPVGPEGTVSASLKAVVPPVPCPCVVRVVTVTGGKSMDRNTPLEIQGAPFAPLPDASKTPWPPHFREERTGRQGQPVQLVSARPCSAASSSRSATWAKHRSPTRCSRSARTKACTRPRGRGQDLAGRHRARCPGEDQPPDRAGAAPARRLQVPGHVRRPGRRRGRAQRRTALQGVYLFGALMVVVLPMTVWRLGVSLVRAIRDHGKERAVERDREVGLPGTSAIRNGKDAGKGPGADPDDPDAAVPAPEAAREPALVPGGGTPRRRVEETMVVGAPLFAGPEPARGREPAAETEAERTKVLPSEPPATRGRSGGTGAVSPSDVANGLAWNAGEERDEP